jgi:hypothetical protein
LTVAAAVAILCAPEAVFATRAGTDGISWISKPGFADLLHLPAELLGGSRVLAWAMLALGCYAVGRALRERRPWPVGFVAAWFVVPVLLAFAISFEQPMFIPYYLIVTLPALVLLAAAGLVNLPNRVACAAALAVLLAFSVVGLSRWYEKRGVEEFRGAVSHVLGRMRPDDGIVLRPFYIDKPFGYYERRSNATGPRVVGFLGVESGHRHPPRIWLVTRNGDTSAELQSRLEQGLTSAAYARVGGRRFEGVTVSLYRASR